MNNFSLVLKSVGFGETEKVHHLSPDNNLRKKQNNKKYKDVDGINVPMDVERIDTVDVERDGPMSLEASNSKGIVY